MEFSAHHFQKIKLGVHLAQCALIFISWAVEIAVFRSSAKIDGRSGWHFGLCFLTIPAIIYLTMTPRFPRTRKFANPYALAAVDVVFCILWLSGFAAVANFNSSGKCGSGCGLSKAVVALGVITWLLWILTSAMSVYGVMYYRREGYLPGASRAPHNAQMIDPDKEAFSTAPHDDEYAPVHGAEHDEAMHDTEEHSAYAPGQSSSSYMGAGSQGSRYDGGNTGGYIPPQVHDENTSYSAYSAPSGSGSIGSAGGRVHFPDGRYENV